MSNVALGGLILFVILAVLTISGILLWEEVMSLWRDAG
jgi:hypothetical protein